MIQSIKSITVNEEKKTTTVIFRVLKSKPIYKLVQVGEDDDPNKTVEKTLVANKLVLEKEIKMARCSADDEFDYYTGVAVILASKMIGSKTGLVKSAKELKLEPELLARVKVSEYYGSYKNFQTFVDSLINKTC